MSKYILGISAFVIIFFISSCKKKDTATSQTPSTTTDTPELFRKMNDDEKGFSARSALTN